jgi:hypothetical protein
MYKCQYCHKEFKSERTLLVHACEPKRRWLAKDEKGVVLGMHTYAKFYEYNQNQARTRTFEDFIASPYYTAFVKFGNYCINTKCIKIERFIEWVVRSGIKLDKWATDATYTQFLDTALKTENVNDALTRAIEYSLDWGEEKEMRPEDVLRYGSENRLCHAIITGKISPWVVYQSQSGQEFLSRLSQEQMQLVWSVIDPDSWQPIFEKKVADVKYAEEILEKAGW